MAFVDFFVFQSLFHEGLPETRQNHFRIACGDGKICAFCKHRWCDDEGMERCSKLQTGDCDDLPIGTADSNTVCNLFESEEEEEEEEE